MRQLEQLEKRSQRISAQKTQVVERFDNSLHIGLVSINFNHSYFSLDKVTHILGALVRLSVSLLVESLLFSLLGIAADQKMFKAFSNTKTRRKKWLELETRFSAWRVKSGLLSMQFF